MAEDIYLELNAAIAYVDEAQSQLAQGNIMVLNDLQENVRKICETIASLPIDQGRSYSQKMVELSEKMQSLEIDLRSKKIEVERELKSTNKSQTAANAYAKANIHSKSSNKDNE